MTRHTSPEAITRPEHCFAAAMLYAALVAAQDGDSEAEDWLRRCALGWIESLCSPGADPQVVHTRLMEHVRIGASA